MKNWGEGVRVTKKDEQPTEYRCFNCNKLLLKWAPPVGGVEIKCPRCKAVQRFQSGPSGLKKCFEKIENVNK